MTRTKFKTTLFILGMTLLTIGSQAWAMAGPPRDPSAPQPPWYVSMFPFFIMIVVFYFLLIRPQMKQKNDRQKMMDTLKKGDKIVTQGGLIATIVNMGQGYVEIRLNDETKVKLIRSGISDVLKDNVGAEKVVTPEVVK